MAFFVPGRTIAPVPYHGTVPGTGTPLYHPPYPYKVWYYRLSFVRNFNYGGFTPWTRFFGRIGGAFLVLPGDAGSGVVHLEAEHCMVDTISDLYMLNFSGMLDSPQKMKDDGFLRLLAHQAYAPNISLKTAHGDVLEVVIIWHILRCALAAGSKHEVSLYCIFQALVPSSFKLPEKLKKWYVKANKAETSLLYAYFDSSQLALTACCMQSFEVNLWSLRVGSESALRISCDYGEL